MVGKNINRTRAIQEVECTDAALNDASVANTIARAGGTQDLPLRRRSKTDAAPCRVPSSTVISKNLGKESGDAPRVVILIVEISHNDLRCIYLYPWVDTSPCRTRKKLS